MGGGLTNGYYSKWFATNVAERSEAAAAAAGGEGKGWCLLQKFVGPAGSRSSTLRLTSNTQCCCWVVYKTRPQCIWQTSRRLKNPCEASETPQKTVFMPARCLIPIPELS